MRGYAYKISIELVCFARLRLLNPPSTFNSVSQNIPTAFYASLTHTLSTPGPHHVIVFDRVVTNFNNSYNRHDGVSTCPEKGVCFNYKSSP